MLTIHAIPGRNIVLGREGENLARSVIFDVSDWISAYGVGTVSLIAQRSGDTEPYPCTVTVDGSAVTWLITAADTARQGYGKCELRYAVGDVLVKSETWLTYTADALGTPAPEAPEPQKAWVDKVLEAGQAAVDASVNSPKIGDNGNWFVWDFDAGAYVDTGVAASGGGSGAVSSVNGKTGAVKLTAKDVGAVPVPKTASVGQTIRVKAVDEAGKPTEWEAADMPSGGGSSLPATGTEDAGKVLTVTEAGVPGWADSGLADKLPKSPLNWEQWAAEEQAVARDRISGFAYRHIATLEITENVYSIIISKDSNGNPLRLRDVIIKTYSPVNSLGDPGNGYYEFNGNPEHFGPVGFKQSKSNTSDVGYGYSRAILLPNNRILLECNTNVSTGKIASINPIVISHGTIHDTLYSDINTIQYQANGKLEIGTIFDVWGIDI